MFENIEIILRCKYFEKYFEIEKQNHLFIELGNPNHCYRNRRETTPTSWLEFTEGRTVLTWRFLFHCEICLPSDKCSLSIFLPSDKCFYRISSRSAKFLKSYREYLSNSKQISRGNRNCGVLHP